MLKFLQLLVLVTLLAGCNSLQDFSKKTVDTLRQAADTVARTAIQGPCAITLGAAQRELTVRERELAILIAETSCGNANATPLTDEEKENLSQ